MTFCYLEVWYWQVCRLTLAPEPCHTRPWITNDHWSWILQQHNSDVIIITSLRDTALSSNSFRQSL